MLSLHMMAAKFTHIDELELSDEEAKRLAEAMARVAALYDVRASEKTLAWMNLAGCVGSIYGTRAFAYSLRKNSEGKKKPAPAPVIPFANGAAFTAQQPPADATM